MNEEMKLIEISGNELIVITYNSSTGTISSPLDNVTPKPMYETYHIDSLMTKVYNANVPNVIGSIIRTGEIINKYTNHVIAKVNINTLDINSTSYDADMDAYIGAITGTIMA